MRTGKLYGMILFIAILSLGLAPLAGAADVNITIAPSASEVGVGGTFDVTVSVDTTVYDNSGANVYLSGAALGIDYDENILEVVDSNNWGSTNPDIGGDEKIGSDLFNFSTSGTVVDNRGAGAGTPAEAYPRIGNDGTEVNTTNKVLFLSGANAGYDSDAGWPFTQGTAKILFKAKFMVKAGVAADTVTNLSLMQTVPPADSNTGWDGTAAVHPLVGTNEDWATTPDDMSDDFFDIPYAFGADASITVTDAPPPVDLALKAGWNMVSLPVTPADNNLTALFDDAEVAFEYVVGTGYVSVTALETGKGYWVKVPGDRTYTLTGTALTTYTTNIPVRAWSLMGAANATATPVTDPADSVEVMFEYVPGTGYVSATQLEAGKAYWVRIKDVTGRDFVSFTVGQ